MLHGQDAHDFYLRGLEDDFLLGVDFCFFHAFGADGPFALDFGLALYPCRQLMGLAVVINFRAIGIAVAVHVRGLAEVALLAL